MIDKVSTTDLISQMVRRAELKQQVISHNVANINTPGFRSMEVRFGDFVAAEEAGGDASVNASVVEQAGLVARGDGNNVNLEQQLGSLTKNGMEFNIYTQLLSARFAQMRSAITGQ